jgi:[ribosomal protein S5]-alanine N-acetyltransferase
MVATPALTTRRLLLRPVDLDDVDALARIVGDGEVMRFVGNGTPLGWDDVLAWIGRCRQAFDREGTGVFTIVLRSTAEVIGYCGIEIGEDTGALELNYALAQPYWHRGFATEAAVAVVEHADTLIDALLATVDPANLASIRLLERLGFVQTAVGPDVHGLPTLFFRRDRGACARRLP